MGSNTGRTVTSDSDRSEQHVQERKFKKPLLTAILRSNLFSPHCNAEL